MSSRRSRSHARPHRLRTLASGAVLVGAVVGCATNAGPDPRSFERRATIERWNTCVERQTVADTLSATATRIEDGCEGHRRDVIRAFPPSMETRLQQLMDERSTHQVRARTGEESGAEPLVRRLLTEFEAR